MQKITPFLWFDGKAEEAMNFYTSIFKNSKIGRITRYGDAGPGPKGAVMSGTFQLDGQEFMALNGGPQFKFTEAISFFVNCETQEDVSPQRLARRSQSHLCLADKRMVRADHSALRRRRQNLAPAWNAARRTGRPSGPAQGRQQQVRLRRVSRNRQAAHYASMV